MVVGPAKQLVRKRAGFSPSAGCHRFVAVVVHQHHRHGMVRVAVGRAGGDDLDRRGIGGQQQMREQRHRGAFLQRMGLAPARARQHDQADDQRRQAQPEHDPGQLRAGDEMPDLNPKRSHASPLRPLAFRGVELHGNRQFGDPRPLAGVIHLGHPAMRGKLVAADEHVSFLYWAWAAAKSLVN